MTTTDTLADLPLSSLFSAPLIAAIDASAQAQQATVDLVREVGFESDGSPATISFEYATSEIDSATGEERRRQKTLSVPVLLFLSLPELVVHEIEQTFSAKIVDVDSATGERPSDRHDPKRSPSLYPYRLTVAPATQSETFARRTRTTFDLDITMRAEIENTSTGLDLLERTLTTTVTDRDSDDLSSEPSRGKEPEERAPTKAEYYAREERGEEADK